MRRKLFGKLLFAAAILLFAGCKDDDEDDIIPPDSTVDGLCINEVCSSGTDWVELYNASEEAIDLSGFFLQDSKGSEEEYIFPEGTTIAAGGFLALEKDTDFLFGISGDGDVIVLLDASGAEVDRVSVPTLEDGQTYARSTDGGETWEVKENGTKGVSNSADPVVPEESDLNLYINEVMSAPFEGEYDFIEIYNAGEAEVDLGGCILQDDKGTDEEYIIPGGTKVGAKSVILFTQVQEGNANGSFGFGLSSKGDKVTFLDSERKVIDEVEIPAMEDGTSYTRVGDGGATWEITTTPTGGLSNGVAPSLKGVVVVNEVYTFSDQSDVNDLDYIELYNTSSQEVDLMGFKLWEGGGREEAWTFPVGSTIPANGFLVVRCDKEGLLGDATQYPAWGLSKNDEVVVFADAEFSVLDSVNCPNLSENEAYGRKTDGAEEWVIFAELTEGESNNGAQERQEVENTLGVYVNEVFTNDQDTQTATGWDDTKDFIELYNATDEAIDLGGCKLYDDKREEEDSYTIPAGTIIEAGGFLTLDVTKNNTNGPAFGLGKGGDAIYFYDKNGTLVDRLETGDFEDNEIYSTGRLTDGGEEIVVFTEVSKNASNNGKATK